MHSMTTIGCCQTHTNRPHSGRRLHTAEGMGEPSSAQDSHGCVQGVDSQKYEPVTDQARLLSCIEGYLVEYNLQNKTRMDLVLFLYAAEHICRISRIIKQPFGNALLVRNTPPPPPLLPARGGTLQLVKAHMSSSQHSASFNRHRGLSLHV